jgi:hypothetical protein
MFMKNNAMLACVPAGLRQGLPAMTETTMLPASGAH